MEELAEAAAESAGLLGLDETAGLPSWSGHGTGAVRAQTSGRDGNGLRATRARSGAETERGTSPEKP